jgi:hypothetical protein
MLRQFFRSWDYTFVGFCTTEDSTVLSWSSIYISRFKDIQRVWRDPDNKENKRTQGIKDVAGAIIDKYYLNMKYGFGNKDHQMWANPPPLPLKHLEYAARDAYATYKTYRRLDVCKRGFFCLWKDMPMKKRGRDW